MRTIKKYSNRRLYDTAHSGYITLAELAQIIREGDDVEVLDAKTGDDLTQPTLAQIILDSRGGAKLLPTSLLTQMIRLEDQALAEFMSKYMTFAMETYLAAKRGASAVAPYFPLATMPFSAANAMARMFGGGAPWGGPEGAVPAPPPAASAPPSPPPPAPAEDDLAALRREIEALKRAVGSRDD